MTGTSGEWVPSVSEKPRYFCSWSGGKDSALALYRAEEQFGKAAALLTMMVEGGRRSRSHGLRSEVLLCQAESLGIPLMMTSTNWDEYEERFGETLRSLVSRGITHGVYGDIDLEAHRRWVLDVSAAHGSKGFQPLWSADGHELVEEFLGAGFRARIVAVKTGRLPAEFLGEELSPEFFREVVRLGCDVCGEEGEYHSVVWDGPNFDFPIPLEKTLTVERDGYWLQDFRFSDQPGMDPHGEHLHPGEEKCDRPYEFKC